MLAPDERLAIPVATASLLLAVRNCDLEVLMYRRTRILIGFTLIVLGSAMVRIASEGVRELVASGILIYGLIFPWFKRACFRRVFR